MKKLTILGILTALFISFQNCAPTNKSSSSATDTGVARAEQYKQFPVSGATTITLWDFVRSQFLDLNLATGHMQAFPEAGQQTGDLYCLNATQLQAVNAILNGAQICQPVIDPQTLQGQVCTDMYRQWYASLGDGNPSDDVHLGEVTSGCDVPTDLCGDQAQQLRDFTTNVVSHLLDGTVAGSCPQ